MSRLTPEELAKAPALVIDLQFEHLMTDGVRSGRLSRPSSPPLFPAVIRPLVPALIRALTLGLSAAHS